MSRIPKITAVIPTYRRSGLLARAISSACGQSFRDIRIAVYDNASDDDTRQVVERLAAADPRIEYYRHETNIGPERNFAFGVSRVTTPFFSLLCDDDVLLPGYYDFALRAFDSCPDAGFFGGSALIVTEAGRLLVGPAADLDTVTVFPAGAASRIAGGRHPALPAVLFRTEAARSAGGIDMDAGSLIDVDLYIGIARRAPFILSREPCGFLTVHDRSWSSNPGRIEREYAHVLEKSVAPEPAAAGSAPVARALAAARDLRLLELSVVSLERSPSAARRYADLLEGLHNRRFARTARALAAVARIPGAAKAVRWLVARRLAALCLVNVIRLALRGERRAALGYRWELRFFIGLTPRKRPVPAR